ncbi:hypothetical protein M0R45_017922 [Rubus argutus]|uniref:BURP domain-containing protein n=1 Tax=Rubus argutus TaxID=59490 RepID=A0AAW1XXK4_RUBAR
MESLRLVLLCSFLYLAVVHMGIYASNDVSRDSYWKTALPKTPIPKSLQELLRPDAQQYIGKDVHDLDARRGPCCLIYDHGAAASGKIQAEPNVTTFFLEKDLHMGNKMTLHFPKTTNATAATLLSRKVANPIPFSKSKLPQILNYFAVKPNSAEAQVIKQTIEECEAPSIKGEYKYCATSLESLVDFTVSRLGKYVQIYSTEAENENKQEYKIAKGVVQRIGDRSVVCHQQNYVYAVFYCHEDRSTRAYVVPLVGADGTKAEAVAVCHTDTSDWNKQHLAFQVLKIKPGTLPICHFLTSGNQLLWVPKD